MAVAQAQGPSVIPVGLDAYRQWDRWDYQRIGERAYMRSTYDRTGGNEGADASHFLYQLSSSNNVTLDVAGPGILYFARYNHWHGSPWHYVVDGTDNVVKESATGNPNNPIVGSAFLPASAFPSPLAMTWSTTQGADLSWVPISFQNSFQMEYGRTCYGTGYYIYHQFVNTNNLSQPLTTWNPQVTPAQDVLDLLSSAGTDISPTNGVTEINGSVARLCANQTNLLVMLRDAPATVRKLSFTVPTNYAIAFGESWLRVTWDERNQPSIYAPVALFFGAGTLYNRNNSQYLVQALPSYIEFTGQKVELSFFFPMPFFRSARVELIGAASNSVRNVNWTLSYQPLTDPTGSVGYFHASYVDHGVPIPGQDLEFLDTRQVEGGGDWSGSFVGTSFIFSDVANLGTLEGDPRFSFDDSHTPQAYGTGTEEWGGGGDYWSGNTTTLPLAGHPTGAPSPALANNSLDMIESAYRFLLADLMPFGKNAVIHLEHGGEDDSTDHYQSVTYWYGAPAASLVKTDEFKVGNLAGEASHKYVSPQASAPYSITSRYEWGVDAYPAFTDYGRTTTGTSEFTLNLNSNNLGVVLRRKLDYSYANQQAQVYVADGSHGEPAADSWALAGTWYLAGANTCLFSDPPTEMGAATNTVETSDRSFRDDEFLVPQNLTQGISALRVQIQFVPANIPLYPGAALGPQAWSEMQYDAYCYQVPDWKSSPGVYQEQAGQVVVEAQHFATRTNSAGNAYHFHIVPDENGVDAPFDFPTSPAGGFLNSRTGNYLHILPGAAAVSAPDRPPWVDYKVYIQTLGAYTLFLRLSGADTSSDSIYAQIVELGGPRLFSGNSSADFSNSWQTAASNPSWVVTQPGLYTVRVSCSQSGAALDAVCLQLAGLPAPAEPGPAESSVATNLPPLLLTSQSPAPNQTGVYPTASVTAQVLDTVLPSDASLYTMWVDGSQVAPTMAKAGSVTSFSFTPATQMALGSAHSVTLLYQDSSPLMGNWTNSWNFTVSATQPPPTFTSTSCARGILSLSWVGGGTLQSTSSLVPPVVWNNVTTNGTFAEPAIGAKFYRLVH